jgi:hypothetical protein
MRDWDGLALLLASAGVAWLALVAIKIAAIIAVGGLVVLLAVGAAIAFAAWLLRRRFR